MTEIKDPSGRLEFVNCMAAANWLNALPKLTSAEKREQLVLLDEAGAVIPFTGRLCMKLVEGNDYDKLEGPAVVCHERYIPGNRFSTPPVPDDYEHTRVYRIMLKTTNEPRPPDHLS